MRANVPLFKSCKRPRPADVFVAIITSATEVGNTRPSRSTLESVARIHEVCFYSLTTSAWDDLPPSADILPSPDSIDSREAYSQPGTTTPVFEHPCMPLTKILSSGSFYYALDVHWDLSSRLAVRLAREKTVTRDILTFDQRFVWNEYILRSMLDFRDRLDPLERIDFDRCQFIVCGKTPCRCRC